MVGDEATGSLDDDDVLHPVAAIAADARDGANRSLI